MISKIGNLDQYKIVVTGAAGFLGNRLVHALLKNGSFVIGIDFHNPSAKAVKYFKNYEQFRFICGDVFKKSDEAINLLKSDKRRKDAIFHLAGLANVKECEENPSQAFKSNVDLTYHVLEFCRLNGIKKFLFPSTGLVYGDHLKHPATEEDPTHPKNLYVSTKVSAEALIQGYAESYGLTCMIARLGNVYGPGGNLDSVIGTLLSQVENGQDISARDLVPVRDFIYIDDVVEGLLHLLISNDEPGSSIVNLSTGVGTSIQKLAETVCQIAYIPTDEIQSQNVSKDSESFLVLNNDLLIEMTEWKPKYSLVEGLSILLK